MISDLLTDQHEDPSVIKPVPFSEVAPFDRFNPLIPRRIVLEAVPPYQRLSVIPVAGDEAAHWRTYHTEGQHWYSSSDRIHDLLPPNGLIRFIACLADQFILIPGSLKRFGNDNMRIGNEHVVHIAALPASFPEKAEGHA